MTTRLSFQAFVVMLLCTLLLSAGIAFLNPEPGRGAEPSTDVYFHTPGVPSGPSAPSGE